MSARHQPPTISRALAAAKRHGIRFADRTVGSKEKVPTHQWLSRNPVAERAPESLAPSAEGDPDSRSRLNLVAGRLTVQNVESRCDQLRPDIQKP